MKIIVGHSNMDLDCIGSMVLAKYLFPDHVAVKSHLVHPMARKLLNLYEKRLGFVSLPELKGQALKRMVVVDTRSQDRIAEYLHGVSDLSTIEFEVFDHHPPEGRDIPGAILHQQAFGANTTQLGLELHRQGVFIEPEDATIALTAIFADTGNFSHGNVQTEDFEVAAFLLASGASLRLVKDFLNPLQDNQQQRLFFDLLQRLDRQLIRGHVVQSCFMELADDLSGLAGVVEQLFSLVHCDILLAFFYIVSKSKLMIVGRNAKTRVFLNELLAPFGGGGHAQAAAATVKTDDGRALAGQVLAALTNSLAPATAARNIMSHPVKTIFSGYSLLQASMYLEGVGHTGAPVTDGAGRLVGFLTLRDIMKGRKGNQMHVPVTTFMSRQVVSAAPDTPVRDIDDLMFEHNIGHLPVLDGGNIVGIVSRADLLEFKRSDQRRHEASTVSLELLMSDAATAD